jgi:hypothetical protein
VFLHKPEYPLKKCIFAPDAGEGQTCPHIKDQKLILCCPPQLVNYLVKKNAFGWELQ